MRGRWITVRCVCFLAVLVACGCFSGPVYNFSGATQFTHRGGIGVLYHPGDHVALVIWVDAPKVESLVGDATGHTSSVRLPDGRTLNWKYQVEKDGGITKVVFGVNGNLDRPYDLAAGRLFLVTTGGPDYEVMQRPLDTIALSKESREPDRTKTIEAAKARVLRLADEDPQVSAFVAKAAGQK